MKILHFLLVQILLCAIIPGGVSSAQDAAVPDSGQQSGVQDESNAAQPDDGFKIVEEEAPVIKDSASIVPKELLTPRVTFRTFTSAMMGDTKDWDKAVMCFDLSQTAASIRAEVGRARTSELSRIIDFIPEIDVRHLRENLPNETEGPPVILLEREEGSIILAMSDDGAWRFTPETLDAISEIHAAMDRAGIFEQQLLGLTPDQMLSGGQVASEFSFRSLIPSAWKERTFILEDWQWLFLLAIILIAWLLSRIVPRIVLAILRAWLGRTVVKEKEKIAKSTAHPFGFLSASAFLWFALGRSALGEDVLVVLLTAAKFATTIGFVWVTYRAVEIVAGFIESRAKKTDSRLDDLLAPFIRTTLKVVVTIFGLIFIASNLDINVTSLLAGVGIGGLAFALAAQDTIANFFGSLTVLFDRPFQVGDWIVIGDVEGTVEEVGFRSTRIRTFYNSRVTVPNADLTRSNVDNYGERRVRRVKTTISVTYNTPPEKIDAFCEGIRELIKVHPFTHNANYHVWLNQFGPASLDILLYCFLDTPDWATELRERHRLFLDIIRLAHEMGISFAFPTQTIHVEPGPAAAPVWPESGTIADVQKMVGENAMDVARKITISELGDDLMPAPVEYPIKSTKFGEGSPNVSG